MKYNEIKNLIISAINKLPLDINNRYIKSHLEMAIIEIKKVEKIENIKSRRKI